MVLTYRGGLWSVALSVTLGIDGPESLMHNNEQVSSVTPRYIALLYRDKLRKNSTVRETVMNIVRVQCPGVTSTPALR